MTGLGAIIPTGNDAPITWQSLLAGKSGAVPITQLDTSKFGAQFACEIEGFNPEDHSDRKEIRRYDRYTQFALAATKEVIVDSAVDLEHVGKNEVGVTISAGTGGLEIFREEILQYDPERGPCFDPFSVPKMISDIAAGLVSIEYGSHGPSYSVAPAHASSTNVITDAAIMICLGKARMMVAGGSEAAVTVAGIGGSNATYAPSTRNDSPETASWPFSASRDGFVLGEGAAILILEEYEHAATRGAKIYAEFAGSGLSADAYHLTVSHLGGLGAKLVTIRALEDTGMKPEDVDYTNIHGTSTPAGDASEVKAIQSVWDDKVYDLNTGSSKPMTGHLLGATGALEAMAIAKSIQEDVVTPTINHEPGDEDDQIDYKLNLIFGKAQKRTVDVAMSSTFGFGDHNVCVTFKKIQ